MLNKKLLHFKRLTWKMVPEIPEFNSKKFSILSQVNEGEDGVSIARIGENFHKNFIGKTGKLEVDIPEKNLQVYRPNPECPISDGIIMYDFMINTPDHDFSFAVALAHIWELLKDQPQAQEGKLATAEEERNIFYVENLSGSIMPVELFWHEDSNKATRLVNSGWVLDSYSEPAALDLILVLYNRYRGENDRLFYSQSA